jgi:hypothetical protein
LAALAGNHVHNNEYEPLNALTSDKKSIPAVGAHQLAGEGIITPGVLGAPFTVIHRVVLVPHPLVAATHILPVV